jgi:hypothetical protein
MIKTTISVLLLALLSGCSGANIDKGLYASPLDAGDSKDVVQESTLSEATPDVAEEVAPEAPTNTCLHNIVRGNANSWLLSTVEMHLIFWGSYPENQKAVYQTDWSMLINYGTVLQRLAEYGIHGGLLDSNYYSLNAGDVLPNADGGAPTSTVLDSGLALLDDSQVSTQLNNDIQLGNLPYPNDDTLYMIMLPPGTATNAMIQNSWGGYHSYGIYGSQRYAYAIISNHGDDVNTTNIIISHELGEAATDPGLNGWYDRNTGVEIGDLCAGVPVQVDGYIVQKFFSMGSCKCL